MRGGNVYVCVIMLCVLGLGHAVCVFVLCVLGLGHAVCVHVARSGALRPCSSSLPPKPSLDIYFIFVFILFFLLLFGEGGGRGMAMDGKEWQGRVMGHEGMHVCIYICMYSCVYARSSQ